MGSFLSNENLHIVSTKVEEESPSDHEITNFSIF